MADIKECDAADEGIDWKKYSERYSNGKHVSIKKLDSVCRDAFKELWESIYGKCSWSLNPWVWVIDFKRIN